MAHIPDRGGQPVRGQQIHPPAPPPAQPAATPEEVQALRDTVAAMQAQIETLTALVQP